METMKGIATNRLLETVSKVHEASDGIISINKIVFTDEKSTLNPRRTKYYGDVSTVLYRDKIKLSEGLRGGLEISPKEPFWRIPSNFPYEEACVFTEYDGEEFMGLIIQPYLPVSGFKQFTFDVEQISDIHKYFQ